MPDTLWQDAVALRHELHRHPEHSGSEGQTAVRIRRWLDATSPAEIIDGLGGHGIAAIYRARKDGPRVLVRCDMDALPIDEKSELEYRSTVPGASHKCGHDGHMAMVSALAWRLHEQPPERGEVVLLYQPAEETGQGAEAVISDEQFPRIEPDLAVALHNLPGFERGAVVLKDGPFASASVGMAISLHGATSHAAQPEHGRSPALAVASLINALSAAPQLHVPLDRAAKVTVIHARLGEVAFGTSPGEGEVMATLRTYRTGVLSRLKERCELMARGIAAAHNLEVEVDWREEFPATVNDEALAATVRQAALELNRPLVEPERPFPWSEDFGHFTIEGRRGVLFGLGSGEEHPALHHPDYDFPDEILPHGARMFENIVRRLLAE